MRSAALSLAMLLAACATMPEDYPTAAEIDAQITAELERQPDDPATLDLLAPGNLAREGRTLVVRTAGRTFRFSDRGWCAGYGSCARFRVDRLFFARYLGIRMVHGEYPDSYLVIDLARGTRPFDTGVQPVPAPVPPLAALADDGEMNQPVIGGLAVVDLGARRVLWHEPEWYDQSSIEAWEGARCVRARYRPQQETGPGATRTVWIAEQGGRWNAHDRPVPGCTAQ